MKVEYDPAIQVDGVLFKRVQRATEILRHQTEGSRFFDTTSVYWAFGSSGTLAGNINEFPYIRLSNGSEEVKRGFITSKLADANYVSGEMLLLWGDLLEAISHGQLNSRPGLTPSAGYLGGDEALDRILDRVADYSEREGHGPDSLKLPIRYATALIKLGPAYWGDLYRQIRESGLKAFDGQTLFGMRVELVAGVDAELQVA